jgi:hypothetical protein
LLYVQRKYRVGKKKYLSYASNASFNKFVSNEKQQITAISKDLEYETPLHLMKHWVNCYNQTTAYRRTTAKVQAIPKKEASVAFKNIFGTASALDKSSQEYKNNAILTLGDYASQAREALKPATENEPDESGGDEGSSSSSSNDNNNNVEDELVRRVNERILHNKVLPRLNVPLKNKTIKTILLRKAAEMISAEDLDAKQLEFVKLCVSKSINLLNHHHVELYKQTLAYSTYNEIIQSALDIKSQLVITEHQFITNLFAELRQFQFDKTCQGVTTLLDDLKAAETDKSSEYYKLLRIVSNMVTNFKVWKLEDDKTFKLAEKTYERKFTEILEVLLEDEDVHIFDGELVFEETQEMITMQGKIDFGRKIDIIAKSRYNDVNLELSSIEFKVQGADDTTFLQQQSKNTRTNLCILNKINSISSKLNSILYMDWRGRGGYLALIHQDNDIAISQYVDRLYIPKNLMELVSCEKTIQNLWMWKDKIIKLNNESKLAAHLQENKYIVAEIGSSHVVRSPARLPSQSPRVTPFFTPTNKRTRKVMEENS